MYIHLSIFSTRDLQIHYVYICTYGCIYIYMYVCMYICVYMYVCVYMYACMYMYVCVYAYMYVRMYVYRSSSFLLRLLLTDNKVSSKFFQEMDEQMNKINTITKVYIDESMIYQEIFPCSLHLFTSRLVEVYIALLYYNSKPLIKGLNSFFSCNVLVALGSLSHNCTPLL